MKTVDIIHSKLILSGSTTKTEIVKLNISGDEVPTITKKFKLTYSSGNAYERFTIEQYDGDKLNLVGTLSDLGVTKDSSFYVKNEYEKRTRIDLIMKKGYEYIQILG